jgi:hypothetical protein
MMMSAEKPDFGVAHPTVIPGSYQGLDIVDADSDVNEDIDNRTSELEMLTQ